MVPTLVERLLTMTRMEHRFVFLAGLHRSGTTLLARLLAAHPEVSGFSGTGADADEGQHLQTVYPAAKVWGGPGRFGFAPEAHFTEEQASERVEGGANEKYFGQWRDMKRDPRMRAYLDLVSLWYEGRVRRWGYSLLWPR